MKALIPVRLWAISPKPETPRTMCPREMSSPPMSMDRRVPMSLSAIMPPKMGKRYASPVYQP